MRALSYHQPRAEQIVRGEKTVDVRTWQIAYRGPLAVHAAATRRADRCRDLGFDPNDLVYGAVTGTVTLTDIQPLDEATYEALRPYHLLDTPFPGAPCYAWFLVDAERLAEPVPVRGRMRLFEVEIGQLSASSDQPDGSQKHRKGDTEVPSNNTTSQRSNVPASNKLSGFAHSNVYHATPPPQPDPARPFALYTIIDVPGYRVALYQWVPTGRAPVPEDPAAKAPGALWSIEIGGTPLHTVTDHLLAALRANGYKATDLATSAGSETPFYLDESSGLRLALILMAVKPLSRHDRIAAIGQSIQSMSDEEAYYWFSKCSAGEDASRAQRALRVLLAGE